MTRNELMSVVENTGCAVRRGAAVFLCDPTWSTAERVDAEILMAASGGTDAGAGPVPVDAPPVPASGTGWLCIRTGGSGGGIKFARHDELTLSAAVRGFCVHFGLERVNAVDVLPPYHVSGLMARLRCAATGGEHVAWDWKRLETQAFPDLGTTGNPWVISLVPTQLQRLLGAPAAVAWLRRFRLVFLGGGPVWPVLADAAAEAGLSVVLSYGMTETAAMVAALKPEEFLAGARSSGTALPHARIDVTGEGRIAIAGDSVFRGYRGGPERAGAFLTEDLGRIDERGHLHVLGRADTMIITGGKKVLPAEVEAALRASGEFSDVAVIGVPDAEWGEAVVACYPAGGRPPDVERAVAALAAAQRPKRFVAVSDWPRNAQGKVNRSALREAARREESGRSAIGSRKPGNLEGSRPE